ncbi:MAG: N-6 DNA methylase [bacterium]
MEEIKKELKALISKYYSQYYSQGNRDISEADVRANYVDKLFLILGWNVYNTLDQDNRYNREKYIRPTTPFDKAGFVDIGLELETEPIIFIETKRFNKILSKSDRQEKYIDRTSDEKQAFRYARSCKIPWAILTNFQRLYLFNVDKEQLILSFDSPSEYLERLDELLLLSKDKVKTKSLEWWEAQLHREEIDYSFLKFLHSWRLRLAQNIYDHNKDNPALVKSDGSFDFEILMDVVQRILSRLLVIQCADDKEVLLQHSLLESMLNEFLQKGAYAKETSLFDALIDLSMMMDKHHNTSIFAPGHLCEQVFISNQTLADIICELCRISFRKFTSDILGATYESYLGYRFTLENGKIKAEIKSEVRRSAGVYYTPPFIVHYIVHQTLGKYLQGKTIDEIKDLKILDPACGSGSFLICAFDILSKFYEEENERIEKLQVETMEKYFKKHGQSSLGFELQQLPQKVLDYPRKILCEHLYGVDIDSAAAEMATINLILKAFEKMSGKQKLPYLLNQNIKVGNSLISAETTDVSEDKIQSLISLRAKLKNGQENKEILDSIKEISDELNIKLNEPLNKYFEHPQTNKIFNWQIEFPEVEGFDIVIGNPPYVNVENLPTDERMFYMKNYTTAVKRFDIYIGMMERGINLLKEGGKLGFIIPYPFLTQNYAQHLRKYLLENTSILTIVDLKKYRIFQDAVVRNIIIICQKGKMPDHTIQIILPQKDPKIENEITDGLLEVKQSVYEHTPDNMFRLELNGKTLGIIDKIKAKSLYLGDIAVVSWGARGVPIEKFHLNEPINTHCKKMIKGENVSRYLIDLTEKWFLYDKEKLYRPSLPELFENEKLVISEVTGKKGLIACFDNERFYTDHSLSLCVLKHKLCAIEQSVLRKHKIYIKEDEIKTSKNYDLKYLLGFINSKLINFYFYLMLGYELNVYPESIEQIPIYKIDFDNQDSKAVYDELVKLVDEMLGLHKQKNEIGKNFDQLINNYPDYEALSLKDAYYSKAEYSKYIEKKAGISAQTEAQITGIKIYEENESIIFKVDSEPQIHTPVLELIIKDENLRLFIFYTINKFLKEKRKKKKWGDGIVVDIILTNLITLVYKTSAKLHSVEYNLDRINLMMNEFRAKVPNPHLTKIDMEIERIDDQIDSLIYKLYNLGEEEIKIIDNYSATD